jgi:hypothetical protein
MAIMAVVAAVFGGAHVWQRANLFREMARRHAQEESLVVTVLDPLTPTESDELAREKEAWHASHAALRSQYEHAARAPGNMFRPTHSGPPCPAVICPKCCV